MIPFALVMAPGSRLVRFVLAAVVLGGCGCTPKRVVQLRDPPGDDHGPGSYRYPDHPAFGPGAFDLRTFTLARDGEDWVVEVEFGARLRRVQVFVTRDDRRERVPQTVDVYFRQHGDEGHLEALPGRGVQFAVGDEWHKVVVLSPVPDLLRRALDATTDLAGDIHVPRRVQVSGRKLRARVPAEFLGTQPPRAVAVLVTGTRFAESFEVIDRVRDELAPQGLVMEVARSPGECRLDDPEGMNCSFAGCEPCGNHPRVIDLLAPAGWQEERLREYGPGDDRRAVAPMVEVAQ